MAIVQYTAAVNQLRGKLNGSTFNKSKTAYTLQRKQSQVKRARGLQGLARQHFQRAQREWKNTTAGQKGSWQSTAANNPATDRFGQQVILSGYNQFIKANIFRYSIGLPTLFTGYASAAPVFSDFADYNIYDYELDETSGTWYIDVGYWMQNDIPGTEFGILVDVSLPYSRGITSYQGRYVFVGGSSSMQTTLQHAQRVLSSEYGIPRDGMYYNVRFRVVHLLSGAVVYSEVFQREYFL